MTPVSGSKLRTDHVQQASNLSAHTDTDGNRTTHQQGSTHFLAEVKSIVSSCHVVSTGSRVLAAAGLIFFAPVMLAAAILVNLESEGPVFVNANKRSVNGVLIKVWAFRTISIGARGLDVPDDTASPPTRLGRFLRKSGLALMPRLLNVLRGELQLNEVLK